MKIRRGEIYRFNLEPTLGSEQRGDARSCLILSLDAFNARLRTVGVIPLSSSPRPLPPIIVAVPSAATRTRRLCAGNCEPWTNAELSAA
jgi:mRNA-degrading endonuclease toxin of MazEF toxin-antitoxin module